MTERPPESTSARIEDIFLAVAAADGADRDRRLDELCGGDDALRAEVRSLLAHHERAEGVLDRPPLVVGAPFASDGVSEATLPPITVAAGYRLRAVLGTGGMGVVYLATQLSTRRTVALKVIRPGTASEAIARRFEHEALLLAKLSHPGIAQVFEAGEADFGFGRQRFIAMEYLDGPTLCDHVDARGLDVAGRLELVARVADATHHAHQRGVIHRDLKPANILVVAGRDGDAIGQPKILDFGVARVERGAVGLTSMGTSVGQLVGTLPYMSPEQVLGDSDDVDVRSDVYALGVLCFRVIAGELPHRFEGASIAEIARIIRDEPPRRISTLQPLAAGDIEAIVNRALEKDRERRYQSAGDLAADIRRSLAHEPIEAHPATTFYYLRKFVRRNRRVAALAAALVVVALVGTAVSIWFGIDATIARGHAEMALDRAERRTRDATESAAQARAQAYLASMAAASAALSAFDAGAAARALESVDLERRGSWEWRHLALAADTATKKLRAPMSAVYDVEFSPDGRFIVSGSFDRTVRLWDSADGALRATLEGHERPVWGIAVSPDGTHVASGSADRTVRLWRVADGTELKRGVGHEGAITGVVWSPDGRLIATSSEDGTVRCWDSETLEERTDLRARVPRARSVCWSPDGSTLAVAADDARVTVFRLGEAAPLATLDGHTKGVLAGAFDPTGATLATGGLDRTCILWDTATWSRRGRIEVGVGGVRSLAFSPDGASLALGTLDGQLRLHAATDGAALGVLLGSTGTVSSVAWHPNGVDLVSASSDRLGVMRTWNVRASDRAQAVGVNLLSSAALGFDPADGRVRFIDRDGMLDEIDGATGETRAVRPVARDRGDAARWACNGERFLEVADDGAMRLFDASDATERRWRDAWPDGAVTTHLAISDDGRIAGIGFADGSVVIEDLQRGERAGRAAPAEGPDGPGVETCVFSPDRRYLAIGSARGAVRLFDRMSGEVVPLRTPASTPGMEERADALAFSPDGSTLAASGREGTVVLWDVPSRRATLTLSGEQANITALAFTPDGSRLATGNTLGGIVLWDLETGASVLSMASRRTSCAGSSFDRETRRCSCFKATDRYGCCGRCRGRSGRRTHCPRRRRRPHTPPNDRSAATDPGAGITYSTASVGRNAEFGFCALSKRFDVAAADSSPRRNQPKFEAPPSSHACTSATRPAPDHA
ncbi:MAG: protein kinase [Phycisphaerae bacterium]|nr:protein kinase [Phycisphaerae bacterium]